MKLKGKKIIGTVMTAVMLISSFSSFTVNGATSFLKVGGWNESLYAQWTDSQPANALVEYKLSNEAVYTPLEGNEKQFLQRSVNGTARVDIPGIKAGTYDLRVTASDGAVYEQNGIDVKEYDRSGYAHFKASEGVGAYNNDGTLKDNAIVLYVTDENKETVTVTSKDGTTVSGIGNILNTAGATQKEPGALTNTNSGIIGKLADDNTPLVIRIVGSVTAPSGLTAFDSVDYGGTKGDNGFMARMRSGYNITVEGVGSDAVIDGWGIHFIRSTSDMGSGKGTNFEARNITFKNVPEDALGMEGQQSGSTLIAPVERCWIHNCTFIAPTISNPAESDKDGGDGACDFKRGQYYTMSYCYYDGYHKTNLIGSSDSSLQYNISFHHNYWNNCDSRGPLLRQANIHIYNNYYYGNASKTIDGRANSYAFVENNFFENCKNPVTAKSGSVVKAYKNVFYNYSGTNAATVVSNRDTAVSSSCAYNGTAYSGFETNPDLFYYNPLTGQSDCYITDANTAKAECIAYSGAMKENPIEPVVEPVISQKPTTALTIPYSINYTAEDAGARMTNAGVATLRGTDIEFENVIYSATSDYKPTTSQGFLKSKGAGAVVFKLDSKAKITVKSTGSKYGATLTDNFGNPYLTVSAGQSGAVNAPAGIYSIQCELTEKEMYLAGFSVEEFDPSLPDTGDDIVTPDVKTVELGTYNIGSLATGENACVEASGQFGNIDYDMYEIQSDCGVLKNDSCITFSVGQMTDLTAVVSDADATVTAVTGKVNGNGSATLTQGEPKVTLTAGTYTITGQNTKIYKLIFEEYVYTTASTTTTETTTEVTTYSVPVEKGEAQTNSQSGISVEYNNNNWVLTDTSTSSAAELTIPFTAQVKGEIVVSGTVTPSSASGKWAFLQILGVNDDGTAGEIAAFGTDSDKKLALRTNGVNYTSTAQSIGAGMTYKYTFIIDMDNKTVQLKFNDTVIESAFTGKEINGVYAITSKSGKRNLTLSDPYVGILSQEIPPVTALKGDADNDGVLTAADSATVLQKVLVSNYTMNIQSVDGYIAYVDIDNDGMLTANDSALILQAVLLGKW